MMCLCSCCAPLIFFQKLVSRIVWPFGMISCLNEIRSAIEAMLFLERNCSIVRSYYYCCCWYLIASKSKWIATIKCALIKTKSGKKIIINVFGVCFYIAIKTFFHCILKVALIQNRILFHNASECRYTFMPIICLCSPSFNSKTKLFEYSKRIRATWHAMEIIFQCWRHHCLLTGSHTCPTHEAM